MAVILPVECIRDQVSASFASTSANLYTSIPRSCFGEKSATVLFPHGAFLCVR